MVLHIFTSAFEKIGIVFGYVGRVRRSFSAVFVYERTQAGA